MRGDRGRDPFCYIGNLETGSISRRSPKNIGISRGLYDGRGAFVEADRKLETHLASIERDAANAIRSLSRWVDGPGPAVPASVWRFVAWQAARTPGWIDVVRRWANDAAWQHAKVVEPPPPEILKAASRNRPMLLEFPDTGERVEVTSPRDFDSYRKGGWKWVFRSEDILESIHIQAWYFQSRHFPRLFWSLLRAPQGEYFVVGDRGVSWLVDGYADTPPAALRDEKAIVVAPLTRSLALVGRHGARTLNVTPLEVNRITAFASSKWIAGPSEEAVGLALESIGITPANTY